MYHSGQKNRLSAGLLLYSNSQPLLLILGKHKYHSPLRRVTDMKKIIVKENQKGLLSKNGKFVKPVSYTHLTLPTIA